MSSKPLGLFVILILIYISCSNSTTSKIPEKDQTSTTKPSCLDGRYEKDVFPKLKVDYNVRYAANEDMQGDEVVLKMDVFEAQEDSLSLRPLMIWAHGGYFCFGNKSNFYSLCKFVSHKGWVSATIDYRKWLQRELPDSLEYLETAIRATHDMHAAIRFFKADAAGPNKYRIDTHKIFVGGYSAGGIMAAQVAYLDKLEEVPAHVQKILKKNGGIRGNSGNAGHSSSIAGAIVIAGALYSKSIIKNGPHPPFLGIQGTEDEIVPFARGWARSPMDTKVIELDGTSIIHNTNKDLGFPTTLLALPEGSHNAAWDWEKETMAYIHDFLLLNTCGEK